MMLETEWFIEVTKALQIVTLASYGVILYGAWLDRQRHRDRARDCQMAGTIGLLASMTFFALMLFLPLRLVAHLSQTAMNLAYLVASALGSLGVALFAYGFLTARKQDAEEAEAEDVESEEDAGE